MNMAFPAMGINVGGGLYEAHLSAERRADRKHARDKCNPIYLSQETSKMLYHVKEFLISDGWKANLSMTVDL